MIEEIIEESCMIYDVTKRQLLGPSRKQDYFRARQFVARKLRTHGYFYEQIGKILNRHHTTIMNMCDDEMRERKKSGEKACR